MIVNMCMCTDTLHVSLVNSQEGYSQILQEMTEILHCLLSINGAVSWLSVYSTTYYSGHPSMGELLTQLADYSAT